MRLTDKEFSEITKFITLLLKYSDENKKFHNKFKDELDKVSEIIINHLKEKENEE